MKSRNKHLKDKLNQVNNFLSTGNEPPADLYDSFIMELKVSRPLVPATEENDAVTFDYIEYENGLKAIPLFTDEDEYHGESELQSYIFSFYADVVHDTDFEGVVINPHTHSFFMDEELLKEMQDNYTIPVSEEDALTPQELKQIAGSVTNDALREFIKKESNFNRYDELMELLKDSVLLNVVTSHEDLSEYAHDGIILTLEVGGFNLAVHSEGSEKYAVLFTGADAIRQTCDRNAGLYYYYQITSIDKVLKFILNLDLDGIILNPGIEEYYIPRNVLLDIYFMHPELRFNTRYSHGTYYAYMI